MIQQIKPICEDLVTALQKIDYEQLKCYSGFTIDCNSLADFRNIDIRKDPKHQSDFEKLQEITGPVVYWFEIISDTDNAQIRKAFDIYKASADRRAIPAINKDFDLTSRILYVGKVKRTFWGRIIQHLGFFTVPATQGLQLFHWAKDIGLQLRVHVIKFDPVMEDLVSIIELKLAKQLNPILGKHK